jgi:hypothetical protein
MPRPPNYNHERKDRERQKAAKKAEKALAKAAAKDEKAKDETVQPAEQE